jgi:hypothetical protein
MTLGQVIYHAQQLEHFGILEQLGKDPDDRSDRHTYVLGGQNSGEAVRRLRITPSRTEARDDQRKALRFRQALIKRRELEDRLMMTQVPGEWQLNHGATLDVPELAEIAADFVSALAAEEAARAALS